MNPYEFYTSWCLTFLLILVCWAGFCSCYIPLGLWQGVFASFCGVAATGTLMLTIYRDNFIDRYFDDASARVKLLIADVLFHYIPFLLMVYFRRRLTGRTFRHSASIFVMISFVMVSSFVYNVLFGTSVYPVPPEFALGSFFVTTSMGMFWASTF